ncbi:hypothetical protein [Alkalihalobacterium elongatum]|uniref:hypothetical protein n=1 Tax=Alkalihalobacterium elongatum TaxID=2675466 RepID=UPI001C1F81F8|nr:hypothetical protein [Alkalihalobacterium elongatum]
MGSEEWLDWQKKIIFDEYIKPELENEDEVEKPLQEQTPVKGRVEHKLSLFPTQRIMGIGGFVNDP